MKKGKIAQIITIGALAAALAAVNIVAFTPNVKSLLDNFASSSSER